MSSQRNTITPKHLAISYKPKSYTDVDFIIPPDMCLTETEKLEYILAEVPQEIWTNIWEFKLIAEKRDYSDFKKSREKWRDSLRQKTKKISDNFKNYNCDKHIYFNFQKMNMEWHNRMYEGDKLIFLKRLKDRCSAFRAFGKLGEYTDEWNGHPIQKTYKTKTLQNYFKTIMNRNSIYKWEEDFFNWIMLKFIEFTATDYGWGMDGLCEINNKHYFVDKDDYEKINKADTQVTLWDKKIKEYENKMMDIYHRYVFDPYYGWRPSQKRSDWWVRNCVEKWQRSPSPHFYK